ncbi:MAG: hypothetical protein U9Q07_03650, partial [Planctomycetota bacterium]|nr:hypothetical protein [Planctomycetota bacterium]
MSLCGLILMMAVIHYENMPSSMYGIHGFNPWNFLFVMTFMAWLASRRREGLTWDMPRHIVVLLLMYLGVILVGVLRAIFDRSYIEDYALTSLISEESINTVKWVIPGIMLYDGCRTRRQLVMAIGSLLLMYFLIAAQVIRHMPVFAALHGISEESRRKICMRIGYSACDISACLAGVSWGILATMPLV